MPIPVATSHDLLLRTLLDKQVDDFEKPIDVKDLVEALPHIDRHACDTNQPVPSSVYNDIKFLERHRLLEFDASNPHVRLTPLGVYTALLFDLDQGA